MSMAEFDREAATLSAIAELSDNEINRVAGLGVSGEMFEKLMGEVRTALRDAYTGDGHQWPDAWQVVTDQVLVPSDVGELFDLFMAVDAVTGLSLSEIQYDSQGPVFEFVAAALREVFTQGVDALIRHVEEIVDDAEVDHVDEDEDEETGE